MLRVAPRGSGTTTMLRAVSESVQVHEVMISRLVKWGISALLHRSYLFFCFLTMSTFCSHRMSLFFSRVCPYSQSNLIQHLCIVSSLFPGPIQKLLTKYKHMTPNGLFLFITIMQQIQSHNFLTTESTIQNLIYSLYKFIILLRLSKKKLHSTIKK